MPFNSISSSGGRHLQGQIVFAQAIFRPRVDFGKRPANDSPGFRPNHGGEPCPSLRFLRCRSRTTLPT